MPGIRESAQKGPTKAADPCHKAPRCASARPACETLKKDQNQRRTPANPFNRLSCEPIRFQIAQRLQRLDGTNHDLEFDHFADLVEFDEIDALELRFADIGGKFQAIAPRRAKHNMFGQQRGQQVLKAVFDKAMPASSGVCCGNEAGACISQSVFSPVIRTGSR
jgi:hypothetical protein